MTEHNATVRETAAVFEISKSTVHKDVTDKLRYRMPALYREVSAVLRKNKEERHLRGGEATRRKYENKRQPSSESVDDFFSFLALFSTSSPYESEPVRFSAGLSALLSGKTTLIDPSFGDVPFSAPSPALAVPAADVKKSVTAKMKKVSLFLIPMFLLLSFFRL